jgi:hypothetical protein
MTIQEIIIGMLEDEARQLCIDSGLVFRVTHRDGICLIPFDIQEHDSNRMNVEIEGGLVRHYLIH